MQLGKHSYITLACHNFVHFNHIQWMNYGGARGGLAHLKDLAAPAKHLF